MPDREIRTVVLVDPSASSIFYLSMLLKRLEYRVVTALSAEDALRVLEGAVPSVILTELSLPKMNGLDFIGQLRKIPRLFAVPVVLLTSKIDPGVKKSCADMGCAAFLFKPVDPETLYRTLQTLSEAAPRANIRINTSLGVFVANGEGGVGRAGTATTISEGGLFIKTLNALPKNAQTSVTILIANHRIQTKAAVAYAIPPGTNASEEPGMAMRFIEISDADRQVIRDYIKQQIIKDLA